MIELSKAREQGKAAERLAAKLAQGLLFVDADGEVLWMDEHTRRRIDGGLNKLNLPLKRRSHRQATLDCFLTTTQVEIDGEPRSMCVIQATPPQSSQELDLRGVIGAIQSIMAEPSWFTGPLIEKLKAKLQA